MAKLDALINKINTLSGVKFIASKFDGRERAWVLVKSSFSAATGTLYVIDLYGNVTASITGVYELGTYSKPVAIGDYCGIMCGTTASPKFKVYKLNGSSLSLHKTVTGFGSYPTYYYFAYISSGEYHATFSSTSTRETTVDINMTTGNVTRIEGSKRNNIQYYNYDNSSFSGLIWNTNSSETLIKAGHISNTSAAGGYNPGNGTPRLSDSYACMMIPLFRFINNKSDLPYEVFGGIYNGGTSYGGTIKNITGLDVSGKPSSLGYGQISLSEAFTRSSACIYSCGALTIVEEGIYKLYTYDSGSGNIVLKLKYDIPSNTGDNIVATRRDAFNIGNPSIVSFSEPDRLITYSELGEFNCTLASTAISYQPNQCVRKRDIVIKGKGNLKIYVEYIVDESFSFETEPAIAFYSSGSANSQPTEYFLLPPKDDYIQHVTLSRGYDYFGLVFYGNGSLANKPYFVSKYSDLSIMSIMLTATTKNGNYRTYADITQAGSSNGKYIYTLENSPITAGSFSPSADALDQVITVTIQATY